jgi:hypothetical protein
MMHGMQWCLSDILGHSWARSIIKAAQRFVSHFEMSNGVKQLLLKTQTKVTIQRPCTGSSFPVVVSTQHGRSGMRLKHLGFKP